MRIAPIVLLLACSPLAAWAQAAPPPGGRVITREEFVQRAAQMAGRRFDMIDTAHSGTVTMAQLRAWREAHQGQGALRANTPGLQAPTE